MMISGKGLNDRSILIADIGESRQSGSCPHFFK